MTATLESLTKDKAFNRAYQQFVADYPEFVQTQRLDVLRATEFSRLDQLHHIYLDYTGGGLYGESQVRKHSEMLLNGVYGNPHSSNPTSQAMTELVEKTRHHILTYFNASPEEYGAIFTQNASGALKLVGESYPFQPGDQYLLTFDNHNSVLGIREFDRTHGATTTYIPVQAPEMTVDENELLRSLDLARPDGNNLFAYPAQSNFSGVQYPLEWIALAQEKGWDVLLDAAAFVPTNRLDLSIWKPDFVPISFYKMFGYPTGIGALIAKREKLQKLHRPWFAGGTIVAVSVQANQHRLAKGEEAFEDGTINYLMIPAVKIGLDYMEHVGVDLIHERVRCLASWLIDQLTGLKHRNGKLATKLYGPPSSGRRGGTVTFNLFNANGQEIDYELVEQEANRRKISLRTGCFCNPGSGEAAFGLGKDEIISCFSRAPEFQSSSDFRGCFKDTHAGAIRVSVGMASNFADVYQFIEFVKELFLE
ncbi:MAG: aminotransferase class V-fold PLP-dependent enzyme [Gemmatimonadetes bacterium]|nr:MAG: aminotransferase class V-fold PLP-dependent enzyme [Gemmatimonadota bacterium]